MENNNIKIKNLNIPKDFRLHDIELGVPFKTYVTCTGIFVRVDENDHRKVLCLNGRGVQKGKIQTFKGDQLVVIYPNTSMDLGEPYYNDGDYGK